MRFLKRENPNRKHLNLGRCNCVSLFSGGLDSYCGAIKLLEDGNKPCLIGHNEYPKLRSKQSEFAETFRKLYPKQEVKFVSFTAGSRAPKNLQGEPLKGTENTSRGRSLLFLCAAVSIAGILGQNVPIYIPENGFIGLNIPLTNSRKGTCSTRTTHPYFMNGFSKILKSVGIHNTINNFFAYLTKREIVDLVKDTEAFKSHYGDTISCSHPCLARYNEKADDDMKTIDEYIKTDDKAICENIDDLEYKTRDKVAQNILSYFRNLVEHIAVRVYSEEHENAFVDYDTIPKAVEFLKTSNEFYFLRKFHQLLQESRSHYTPDNDGAERLLLKYYEYLLQIKDFVYRRYQMQILSNIDKFPIDLDDTLQQYYEKIVEKMEKARYQGVHEAYSERFYVQKSKPFFVNHHVFMKIL